MNKIKRYHLNGCLTPEHQCKSHVNNRSHQMQTKRTHQLITNTYIFVIRA